MYQPMRLAFGVALAPGLAFVALPVFATAPEQAGGITPDALANAA